MAFQGLNSSSFEDNGTQALLANNTIFSIPALPPGLFYTGLSVRFLEGLIAVTGNSLTCFAFVKFPHLLSDANILILALAVADVFGGFTCLIYTLTAALKLTDIQWVVFCATERILNNIASTTNVGLITLIGIDRCFYISFPLKYYVYFTVGRLAFGCMVIVFLCVILSTSVLVYGIIPQRLPSCTYDIYAEYRYRNGPGVLSILFYVFTICIICLYTRIAYIARKQAVRMDNIQPAESAKVKREWRIVRLMAKVLGIYLICYLPYSVILILEAVIGQSLWLRASMEVSGWLWWGNAWANPVIYAWKSKELSAAFREILGIKRNNQVSAIDMAPPNRNNVDNGAT